MEKVCCDGLWQNVGKFQYDITIPKQFLEQSMHDTCVSFESGFFGQFLSSHVLDLKWWSVVNLAVREHVRA